MSKLISLTRDSEIAVITVNNPPVNALSPGVPEGIKKAIEDISEDGKVKGAVLIGGGRTFIAGADINEFGKITSGEKKRDIGLHPVLEALENCPKPVVCAIHGTAFGGGLEVAMACHYRVAVSSAQVGQPEVKLGIIPGAGGTQRLPRLAGVVKAAELCAAGNPIKAKEALALGIIDEIVDEDLLSGALAFVRNVNAEGKGPRKTSELDDKLKEPGIADALTQLRQMVSKKARDMMAPLKAIDAVEAATKMSFADGIKKEAELFEECLFSDQSKGLIHIFFSERGVAKIPGLPKGTPIKEINRAAVVGAGTMGGGIAMNYANAGIPVLLKEVTQEALDRGLTTIQKNYAATVKKGRLSQEDMEKRMALIEPTLSFDKFKEADIIVEAVFEEMALKKKVFAELEGVTRPDAILASNTSTLNVDEIASATTRPANVIGHHFFSPANVMKLLEIVRGAKSSPDVISTSMALAKRLRKVGVLVGNCRGFVGNRMFGIYHREAEFLLEEGAKVEEVDAVLYKFGMAMGAFAVLDLAGLDVGWRIRKEYKHLHPPGQRDTLVGDKLCEMGRFGQKTGAGWYKYAEGDRTPQPDPEVEKLIRDTAQTAGIKQHTISPEEIIERTVYSLINEGANILDDGIAIRSADIDIIYIYGYGFPAHRGGPMFYGDTVGLDKVLAKIQEFEKEHGEIWKPAPLLERLVKDGKTFADWDQEKKGR